MSKHRFKFMAVLPSEPLRSGYSRARLAENCDRLGIEIHEDFYTSLDICKLSGKEYTLQDALQYIDNIVDRHKNNETLHLIYIPCYLSLLKELTGNKKYSEISSMLVGVFDQNINTFNHVACKLINVPGIAKKAAVYLGKSEDTIKNMSPNALQREIFLKFNNKYSDEICYSELRKFFNNCVSYYDREKSYAYRERLLNDHILPYWAKHNENGVRLGDMPYSWIKFMCSPDHDGTSVRDFTDRLRIKGKKGDLICKRVRDTSNLDRVYIRDIYQTSELFKKFDIRNMNELVLVSGATYTFCKEGETSKEESEITLFFFELKEDAYVYFESFN